MESIEDKTLRDMIGDRDRALEKKNAIIEKQDETIWSLQREVERLSKVMKPNGA